MRLKNKKTGEIREARIFGEHLQLWSDVLGDWIDYDDLDYLAKWWERYEEPKEYWCINWTGSIDHITILDDSVDKYEEDKKLIGNYFTSKEEAEKAVEKLKAIKRLKDKGLKFHLGKYENKYVAIEANWGVLNGDFSDVFILFGGEE